MRLKNFNEISSFIPSISSGIPTWGEILDSRIKIISNNCAGGGGRDQRTPVINNLIRLFKQDYRDIPITNNIENVTEDGILITECFIILFNDDKEAVALVLWPDYGFGQNKHNKYNITAFLFENVFILTSTRYRTFIFYDKISGESNFDPTNMEYDGFYPEDEYDDEDEYDHDDGYYPEDEDHQDH